MSGTSSAIISNGSFHLGWKPAWNFWPTFESACARTRCCSFTSKCEGAAFWTSLFCPIALVFLSFVPGFNRQSVVSWLAHFSVCFQKGAIFFYGPNQHVALLFVGVPFGFSFWKLGACEGNDAPSIRLLVRSACVSIVDAVCSVLHTFYHLCEVIDFYMAGLWNYTSRHRCPRSRCLRYHFHYEFNLSAAYIAPHCKGLKWLYLIQLFLVLI